MKRNDDDVFWKIDYKIGDAICIRGRSLDSDSILNSRSRTLTGKVFTIIALGGKNAYGDQLFVIQGSTSEWSPVWFDLVHASSDLEKELFEI
jgi:hypothetical protein